MESTDEGNLMRSGKRRKQNSLSQTPEEQLPTAAMDLRQSISNQIDNSFSLARHVINACAADSNFVLSPLSIHVLLGMVAAGSNAPTADQIVGFVTSTSSDELPVFFSHVVSKALADGGPVGGPVLSTANGLWLDQRLNLKPAYRDILESVYRAVSKNVDFQNKAEEVREEVNAWGSKETKGLIKNILTPGAVDAATKLILANAVYFKGKWSEIFEKKLTKERDFYLLDGSSVRAPMMSNYKLQHFRAFDGFKVLKLPYEQGKDSRSFSMYIYLPDSVNGLPSLRERLCSESGFIDSHLPYYGQRLDKFLIPKFKFGFEFEASGLLKSLGLVLPFEGGSLTKMVDSPFPLVVSGVFHKAFVEVDEEGTRAAAVTAARKSTGCPNPLYRKKLEFVADHPFLFVIREDKTGVVLFIGELLNPLA